MMVTLTMMQTKLVKTIVTLMTVVLRKAGSSTYKVQLSVCAAMGVRV